MEISCITETIYLTVNSKRGLFILFIPANVWNKKKEVRGSSEYIYNNITFIRLRLQKNCIKIKLFKTCNHIHMYS